MKEQRFFYTPTPKAGQLPTEEAQHAVRVLRMGMGDELFLMDGQGSFYRAVITEATNHQCRYRIEEVLPQTPEWHGQIHVAVAPTKNMDRMEWLAEKATEVGMNRMSLLDCRFSERRVVKTERLEKILVSAMKQSHKAWKPQLDEMMPFSKFIAQDGLPEQRFIAHCYEGERPYLMDVLNSLSVPVGPPSEQTEQTVHDVLVMIGPEGDFSIDEVRAAEAAGFRSVSLGTSRLRTETAALVAVHLMRIAASN